MSYDLNLGGGNVARMEPELYPETDELRKHELTAAGLAWARGHYEVSITARVALWGTGQGWPEGHVATAVAVCNREGGDTDAAL